MKPLTIARRTETRTCHCGHAFEAIIFGAGIATRVCPECAERFERDRQLDAQRDIERRWRQHVHDAIAAAEIPALFAHATLPPESHSGASAAAFEWVEQGGGLWLYGAVGVGKSHLAGAAAVARMRATGKPVRWIGMARLMLALRSGFGSETHRRHVELAVGDGDAVLDDIDKVSPSEYGLEVMFAAVNARVEAEAAWIVTGNLGPDQLADRVGDAVVSRLAIGRVYEMAGEDRRLKGARS